MPDHYAIDPLDHPKGYEVWGKDKRSKEPKRVLWQPTRGAVRVSYDRLTAEGMTDLTIRKVGTEDVYNSPEAL